MSKVTDAVKAYEEAKEAREQAEKWWRDDHKVSPWQCSLSLVKSLRAGGMYYAKSGLNRAVRDLLAQDPTIIERAIQLLRDREREAALAQRKAVLDELPEIYKACEATKTDEVGDDGHGMVGARCVARPV